MDTEKSYAETNALQRSSDGGFFSMDLLREETAERHFDGMEAD